MLNAIQMVIQNLQMYYADGIFLTLTVFSYIYLFAHVKSLRWKFLIPIAVIVFCIINPILYRFVFYKIIYWRLFWMIPDAMIIAITVVYILKATDKRWCKVLLYGIFVCLILAMGTNVYKNASFEFIQNPHKVSSETKVFCTKMLEISEHPKCIAPRELYYEIRQYDGDIEMLYGRNADGYIDALGDEDRRKLVNIEMDSEVPDYDFVLNVAVDESVTAVIVYAGKRIPESLLRKYKYKEIFSDQQYILYYLLDA